MQDIGYDKRNALLSLGTFTFIIIFYVFNLGFALVIKFIIHITKNQNKGKVFYKFLIKGLFFNMLCSMGIEGMIEFIICGYLNLMTLETTSNGEILGMLISVFCLCLDIAFLPLTIIWLVCFKNVKKLSSERYEEKFGPLFDGVYLKRNASRIYFLIFWARRIFTTNLFLWAD